MTERQILDTMIAESSVSLAELHEVVEMQKRYVEHLKRRRARLGNSSVEPTNGAEPEWRTKGTIIPGSLPAHIIEVMRGEGGPLACSEIVSKLEEAGVTTDAKSGLTASVFSALNRRNDLFSVTATRGVYELTERPE